MRGWNRVQILGVVVNEPTLVRARFGELVLKLHIEARERAVIEGERVGRPQRFRAVLVNKLAKVIAGRVRQGVRVVVEGSLRQLQHTDRCSDLHDYEVVVAWASVLDEHRAEESHEDEETEHGEHAGR